MFQSKVVVIEVARDDAPSRVLAYDRYRASDMMLTMPNVFGDTTLYETDRRGKPRIDCNYHGRVRTNAASGSRLDSIAYIKNLSASGLYLQIDRHIEPGQAILVLIEFSPKPNDNNRIFSVAARGIVVRTEPQSDGKFGLAVRFHHYRLL